ncbi:hypothetical protein C7212DRAFT_311365 [Tuber magnatum]|uniref:Uncharacterized protein n=1 Tax=Tuber magnatum TaxID=42249 RepID=A0A317T0V4_9PEZI|nr:hypothetical protein C7212DRAFT_311365 [Tuber magnatum]
MSLQVKRGDLREKAKSSKRDGKKMEKESTGKRKIFECSGKTPPVLVDKRKRKWEETKRILERATA